MLGSSPAVAFVPTADLDRARAFYEDVLGLTVLSQDAHSVLCEAGGTQVRVTKLPLVIPQPQTILGFAVQDIGAMVAGLSARGVTFERYPFFGPAQDERGIWTATSGALVAWFKDVDGNLLSIQQTS